MGSRYDDHDVGVLSESLFLNLIQNIRYSLTNIVNQIDTFQLTKNYQNLETVKNLAHNSDHLIECYKQIINLFNKDSELLLDAISLSGILFDVVNNLKNLSNDYNVNLIISSEGNFYPVMSNKVLLESSLISLGIFLIESLPALLINQENQIQLYGAIHRSKYGLVIGLYFDDQPKISYQLIKKSQKLLKDSYQPLPSMSYNSASGLFLAKNILNLMGLDLIVSKHHSLHGLGFVVPPIKQMSFVNE